MVVSRISLTYLPLYRHWFASILSFKCNLNSKTFTRKNNCYKIIIDIETHMLYIPKLALVCIMGNVLRDLPYGESNSGALSWARLEYQT